MKTVRMMLSLACIGLLSANSAFAQNPTPAKPAASTLTIDVGSLAAKSWTGDLDGMIERRAIRVLTTRSKTFFFVDKGVNRGIVADAFAVFEDDLNKKLAAEGKLKNKNLRVRVLFIPVPRDRLLSSLAEGKGDIAAGNLTVTPERQKLVDFAAANASNVSEVVVTGPASPTIATLDDLAGKEVFVRKSSSYYESIVALNKKFTTEKKAPLLIKEAPETLEDEDLLEMLNAGLVATVVVDKHIADFWKQVFPKLTVHDGVTLRTGGEIAWAIRKGSPQLKAALDEFVGRNKIGTSTGNQMLTRYLKNTKYVKNAAAVEERKKFQELLQYFRKYGDQYKVDPILMAAQGYQESQLNQNAKSCGGRDRGHAGDARYRQGAEGRRHHADRGQHPRRHQVHALHDRPVLRQGADDRSRQGAVRLCLLQRRSWPHLVAAQGGRQARARSQRLVPERRVRGGREDRPGNDHLRQQHLQVLHRIPADPRESGCDERSGRQGQGWYQMTDDLAHLFVVCLLVHTAALRTNGVLRRVNRTSSSRFAPRSRLPPHTHCRHGV